MNAIDDLSPEALRQMLMQFKTAVDAQRHPGAPNLLQDLPHRVLMVGMDDIEDALRAASRPMCIVFKPTCRVPAQEVWAIHQEGEPERLYRCSHAGLFATWLAIKDAGRTNTVRAADFAAPDAAHAANSVRTAIRRTAVEWVETNTGCRPLAAAMRCIEVGADGLIRYVPSNTAPKFDTEPE